MMPLFLPLALNFPNFSQDLHNLITAAVNNQSLEIASDAAFTNKTTQFSPSQLIYVRASAQNDGASIHNLNLRDNNYNLITTYSMVKTGSQFTVNFPAPSTAGTYSLEANITSGDSVTNLVQTITVSGSPNSNNNSEVHVTVKNEVNTNNQVLGNQQASPQTSAKPSPSPSPKAQNPQSFFSAFFASILGFFKNLL